jgi:hypothetical protein
MRRILYLSLVVFIGLLVASWLTHGTGVIRNDVARNIYIPDEPTMPLQVKAAYNGRSIFFRYRWPTDQPHIYHDMLKYEGGKWVRYGASVAGPQPQGIYEDRVAMMVDDGSVPEFGRYGGYITIGDRMRFFTDEAPAKEVAAHPYLGAKKGQAEVGKHLPGTRRDINDWSSVVPEEELARLRAAGYFLDLWHWRAHRSNPVGKSDDQVIAEARYGDAGKGPFFTNWDGQKKQPRLMFDSQKTGRTALDWNDLAERRLGFGDLYYLREDQAVAFDPKFAWKDGDTIPQRVLRAGDGSRADISVVGPAEWRDGFWDVTLVRAMNTGHPLEDKAMVDKGFYSIAFAVHRGAYGSRWHYVSLPVALGLDRDAQVTAVRFDGDTPGWEQPWSDVTLFYPGQVSWPMLTGKRHAGSTFIKDGVPVRFRHNERQLAQYGIEAEFADEIWRQWMLTLLGGVLLIAAFGVGLNLLLGRERASQ